MVRRKTPTIKGDKSDPNGMATLAERLEVRNYSDQTVRNRRLYLGYFIAWCEERSIARPSEVTRPILELYQRHLYFYRKKNGKPLTFRSQHAQLTLAIRISMHRWNGTSTTWKTTAFGVVGSALPASRTCKSMHNGGATMSPTCVYMAQRGSVPETDWCESVP